MPPQARMITRRRTAVAAVIIAVFAISWLGLQLLSQAKQDTPPDTEAGCLYLDENQEPQIEGQLSKPERVSLVRLIAERERYDGKEVVTQGFFVRGFEHYALYLHREDALNHLTYNGLVLDGSLRSPEANEENAALIKRCHLQYVTIIGTFHKLGRGHLGAYYAGTLKDLVIYRVERKVNEIPPLRTRDASSE